MLRHTGPLSGVAAFEDIYVATAGYDNRVILWDARSQVPLAQAVHDHLANQVAFSPQGDLLVTSSSDHSARIWSVPELRLQGVITSHSDDIEMAVFSPDGDYIATASRDRSIGIHLRSGAHLRSLIGHEKDVLSVSWSPDGLELLSSGDDGTLRRWNPHTGELLEQIDLQGVETDTLAILPDGGFLAGSDDGALALVQRGRVRRYPAHEAGVKRVCLSEDSKLAVSISYDRTLALWSLTEESGLTPLSRTEIPPEIWARSCAFLGGSKLILGTFGSTYATFDLATCAWDTSKILPNPGLNSIVSFENRIYGIGDAGILTSGHETQADIREITRIGSLCNFLRTHAGKLYCGGQLGVLYDAITGRELHRHTSPLNCASSLGTRLLVGSYTGEILIFRPNPDGSLVLEETRKIHSNAIKGIAASPENPTTFFSVCATGAVSLSDISGTSIVHENGHERIANACVALGPDLFCSTGRDRSIRFWTSQGCREILKTPHTHSIKAIAERGSGRWIATGSYRGQLAVFDTLTRKWTYDRRYCVGAISNIIADEGGFYISTYEGHTTLLPNHEFSESSEVVSS